MQRCYEGNFFLIGYFEKNGRVLLERAGFHRSLLEAHSVSLGGRVHPRKTSQICLQAQRQAECSLFWRKLKSPSLRTVLGG
jgi:hypothetical protein